MNEQDKLFETMSTAYPEIEPRPSFTSSVMSVVSATSPKATVFHKLRSVSFVRLVPIGVLSVLVVVGAAYMLSPMSRNSTDSSDVAQTSIADKPVLLPTDQPAAELPAAQPTVEQPITVAQAKQKVKDQVNSIEKELALLESELDFVDKELSDEALIN